MPADRTVLLAWIGDLAAALVTDATDLADVNSRIAAAPALGPSDFAGEAMALMKVIAESVTDVAGFDRIAVPVDAADATLEAATILTAIGLALAGGRPEWPSRRTARRARTRIAEAGEAALLAIGSLGGEGANLYGWMWSLVTVSCRLISDIAADAAPIVRVETGVSLPSTVLAYQLYGDAARAESLVDIAGASTPLVMPVSFDALAV